MPQCAAIGRPGQTGHVSPAALSQTVMTRSIGSASGPANSCQLFERRPSAGRPVARSTSSAIGCGSPFGWLPTENARKRPSPMWLSSDSARIERAELPVQRNRTVRGVPVIAALTTALDRRRRELGRAAGFGSIRRHQLVEPRALSVIDRLAGGEEGFPDSALRIGDPALLRLRVAAGGRALLKNGAVGCFEAAVDFGQLVRALNLNAEMLDPFRGALAARDGEVDPGVLQHPLGIVRHG